MLYVQEKEVYDLEQKWFDRMDRSNWNSIFQFHLFCKSYNPWNLITNLDLESVEYELAQTKSINKDPISQEMLQQIKIQLYQIQNSYSEELYKQIYNGLFTINNKTVDVFFYKFYDLAKEYIQKKTRLASAQENKSDKKIIDQLKQQQSRHKNKMIKKIVDMLVNVLMPITEKINEQYHDDMVQLKAQAYKMLNMLIEK